MGRHDVIFLIDDDPSIRHAVTGLLESADYSVVSFGSANEFLRRTLADEPQCLILDLELPGISGLELQRKLVAEDGPPVIFISGRGDIPSTVRAMKAGALEFLVKPVDSNELLAAVSAGISRHKRLKDERSELAVLRQRYARLSSREREVFPLVVSGLMNKQSASTLGIAEVTLQIHRRQIMAKMEADSLPDLVRMASRLEIPLLVGDNKRKTTF